MSLSFETRPAGAPQDEGQRSAEAKRLARIRAQVLALAKSEIALVFDGDARILESLEDGRHVTIAHLTRDCRHDEAAMLGAAGSDLGFLLALLERAIGRIKVLRDAAEGASPQDEGSFETPSAPQDEGSLNGPHPEEAPLGAVSKDKNFAAEAAMLCGVPAFQKYLMEVEGMEESGDAAAYVRGLLRISSRAELNNDARAEAAWKQLRASYRVWKDMPMAGVGRFNGHRQERAVG
jgi:hypothetical protein